MLDPEAFTVDEYCGRTSRLPYKNLCFPIRCLIGVLEFPKMYGGKKENLCKRFRFLKRFLCGIKVLPSGRQKAALTALTVGLQSPARRHRQPNSFAACLIMNQIGGIGNLF